MTDEPGSGAGSRLAPVRNRHGAERSTQEARPPVDVAVIGGGPAGASAARLLAAWGHSVLLLTKSDAGAASLAESLPPSCRKVFEAVGVREAIDAAGFLTAGGNTVCWDGAQPRAATFGTGLRGLQVLRRDFDRVLLAEARRAGAVVRTGVTARSVRMPGAPQSGEGGVAPTRAQGNAPSRGTDGTVRNATGENAAPGGEDREGRAGDDATAGPGTAMFSGRDDATAAPGAATLHGRDEQGRPVTVRARFVLDCSGRAGVLARRHRTRVQAGETTLALVGVWRRAGRWPLPDCATTGGAGDDTRYDAQTVVEAYADGWAWSVPVSPTRRYVTVMVDPHTTQADRAGSLRARYLAELGKTTHLARLVAGAALEAPPWACDASQYGARRFGGPGFLLVGDAATFIDPLSSFGVKKAMASGWQAAIVANTCLRHPERAALAQRFHAEREQRIWESYRRHSAAFFAQVSRRELHPFWSDRSDPAAGATLAEAAGGDDAVAALRDDPAVREAFEALRRAPAIRLRPTSAVRTTTIAAVEGREIVAAPSLSLDLGDAGVTAVRHLRNVDLPALLSTAPRYTQVPDLYADFQRSHGPVALPDFLGALSVLLGKGQLRNES